jgi:hypothetical protein
MTLMGEKGQSEGMKPQGRPRHGSHFWLDEIGVSVCELDQFVLE